MTVALGVLAVVVGFALIVVRATRWGNAARDRVEGKPRKPITPGTWVVFGIVLALAATSFAVQLVNNQRFAMGSAVGSAGQTERTGVMDPRNWGAHVSLNDRLTDVGVLYRISASADSPENRPPAGEVHHEADCFGDRLWDADEHEYHRCEERCQKCADEK